MVSHLEDPLTPSHSRLVMENQARSRFRPLITP